MKVLFDHPNPFFLAHGGFQIQIEQTKMALESVGVQTDYLKWWDEQQIGQIIHYFGRPAVGYVELAQKRGIRVVLAELLTELGSRSALLRLAQQFFIKTAQSTVPRAFSIRMGWDSFRLTDACVALTPWEAKLMIEMFNAPPERLHIVPNGVEDIFLEEHSTKRRDWLVCTATITERKRVLELAEACVVGRTPIRIIGKPYVQSDPYALRFLSFAKEHPEIVRYDGAINERRKLAEVYREARGFVLLSAWESLSLSALEAAACGFPLLLSDLPWARTVFGQEASYCRLSSAKATSEVLRRFYAEAPKLKAPPRPKRWIAVAQQLKSIYESLLRDR